MRRPFSTTATAVCLLVAVSFLAACAQILGIEERQVEADAGDDGAVEEAGESDGSKDAGPDATDQDGGGDAATDAAQEAAAPDPACEAYCDTVMDNCAEEDAAYSSRETCLAVCAHMESGDPEEPEGNTLACRADQARAAPGEPNFYCPRAAPGGAGTCGTNCESYCSLYAEVCPDEAVSDCVSLCQAIPDTTGFDANADFEGGDTIQCRLAHLSAAAFRDPELHCVHAQLVPTEDSPCNLKSDEDLNCEDYCRLVNVTCTGDRKVYESVDQCERACAHFDVGKVEDTSANTLGCRRYHSYAALPRPQDHCAHSGVGGDGHCGPLCETYCSLLEEGCGEAFDTNFGSATACTEDCLMVASKNLDVGYSVESGQQDGPTIQCRLFELTRALAGTASACEAAAGGGRCQ